MTTLFLTCLAVGGVVLLAQLVLAVVGVGGHGVDVDHGDAAHGPAHELHHGAAGPLEGLQLFSVRSLSAGVAFFGLAGLGGMRAGWPAPLAAAAALVAGLMASVAVAMAMRALLRLERDGTVRLAGALGSPATVYVPVPAAGGGPGKILLTLQGRTVECQAVTSDPRALPTGTPVTVVDVHAHDLLGVV